MAKRLPNFVRSGLISIATQAVKYVCIYPDQIIEFVNGDTLTLSKSGSRANINELVQNLRGHPDFIARCDYIIAISEITCAIKYEDCVQIMLRDRRTINLCPGGDLEKYLADIHEEINARRS
jgi:hypothetical protein